MDEQTREYIAQMMGDQLDGQAQATREFNDAQADHVNATKAIQEEMFKSIMGKKNSQAQYPPQVLEIANALTAQPALIPPVQRYVTYLFGEINRHLAELTNAGYGGMPPTGEPSPQPNRTTPP